MRRATIARSRDDTHTLSSQVISICPMAMGDSTPCDKEIVTGGDPAGSVVYRAASGEGGISTAHRSCAVTEARTAYYCLVATGALATGPAVTALGRLVGILSSG